MSKLSRREFLKRTIISGTATATILSSTVRYSEAAAKNIEYGTLIDLTKCNGCTHLKIPACVSACKAENNFKFPKPIESKKILNYWPHDKKEDWSAKKNLIDRLTPYNWIFLQKTTVSHNGKEHELFIPRRCMHCDNPPCAHLCPFGAQSKKPNGAVIIDHSFCFGGAKCRDVCMWNIPARQAGVGLYLKIAPKYAGGGVMYKCDLCYHRIENGKTPACVESCPTGALQFGEKNKIKQLAYSISKKINGYVYGDKEHGGTSTFYVSQVPFEKINQKLAEQKAVQPNPNIPGYPLMPVSEKNILNTPNGLAYSMLLAPIAGLALAGFTAYKTMKNGGDE